jgi:hypothetical protein
MAQQTYRLVGSQDPTSRIERVLVESPSDEYPEGKRLELGGAAVPLSAEQVAKLSAYARLEPVKESDAAVEPPIVDQPGVQRESMSTDNPPDLGTVPDFSNMSQDELYAQVERERRGNAAVMPDVNARSSKKDLQQALNDHYAQGS